MSRRIFYIERYVLPLPEGHKFPVGKYGLLRSALAEGPRFRFDRAPLADRRTIELAHDPLYVKQFMNCELPASSTTVPLALKSVPSAETI